jgi:hypothetical protein
MLFYPQGSTIPDMLKAEDFLLRPLRAIDAALDFAALMESQTMLRGWSQSDWPTNHFTVAENALELQVHEDDHRQGISFTYTVMGLAESECLGCVYINPLAYPLNPLSQHRISLSEAKDCEAGVTFWVRQSDRLQHLDKILLAALISWFKEKWAFKQVMFLTPAHYTHQIHLFEEAGLIMKLDGAAPTAQHPWLVYK